MRRRVITLLVGFALAATFAVPGVVFAQVGDSDAAQPPAAHHSGDSCPFKAAI